MSFPQKATNIKSLATTVSYDCKLKHWKITGKDCISFPCHRILKLLVFWFVLILFFPLFRASFVITESFIISIGM